MKTNEFSYTLAGGGSIQTGSKGVMTLNLNRLIQLWYRNKPAEEDLNGFFDYLAETVKRVHKYLTAFNEIVLDYERNGLLPVYKAGYNSLNKKYLTIGLQAGVESYEFLTKFITKTNQKVTADNEEYAEYINKVCAVIADLNSAAKTPETRFNTEFVPSHYLWTR